MVKLKKVLAVTLGAALMQAVEIIHQRAQMADSMQHRIYQ